ncbi:FAD-dependent oxidoreductase [Pelomonas sp. SE-A7]|uniref:FAD-dependent oxidoreductase n=1 Tax=Pelomonas sp. SE-A7 TaxID=3054953 RepID=UPI00259D1824|nr:FAD-dependent oxidoreductase [Pelomonas sp. SE-A7]MDM4767375.1 FAD-dependent oxidoreductase [Pelomonas sp. SE-A7]
MRIAVIGAGIAGVCSAFELAMDGHEVTVFERLGGVAGDSSFAHGGLLAPSFLTAWSAIGRRALLQPRRRHASLQLSASRLLSPALWRAVRFDPEVARKLQPLLSYSQSRQTELRHALKLDYEREQGLLMLLRGERDRAAVQAGIDLLTDLKLPHKLLDASECLALEPGLSPDTPLVGGIQLPQDEIGNSRQFAHLIRVEARRLGVRFRFHTTVRKIEPGPQPQLLHAYTPPMEAIQVQAADSDSGGDTRPETLEPRLESFDAILVCTAGDSSALLRPLGLKLPLQTWQGHSITAPLRQLEAHPDLGPRSALVDAAYHVSLSRLGQRVRVTGVTEIGGHASRISERAIGTLHKVLHDWFPGAIQHGAVQRWRGSRTRLPDGLPLLGASGLPGLWLNLAHGDSGWSLANGTARALADQIAGRAPAVEVAGMDISRLG